MRLVDVGVEGSKLGPGQVGSDIVGTGVVEHEEVRSRLVECVGRCRVSGRAYVLVLELVRPP